MVDWVEEATEQSARKHDASDDDDDVEGKEAAWERAALAKAKLSEVQRLREAAQSLLRSAGPDITVVLATHSNVVVRSRQATPRSLKRIRWWNLSSRPPK